MFHLQRIQILRTCICDCVSGSAINVTVCSVKTIEIFYFLWSQSFVDVIDTQFYG